MNAKCLPQTWAPKIHPVSRAGLQQLALSPVKIVSWSLTGLSTLQERVCGHGLVPYSKGSQLLEQ